MPFLNSDTSLDKTGAIHMDLRFHTRAAAGRGYAGTPAGGHRDGDRTEEHEQDGKPFLRHSSFLFFHIFL